ncbi:hypothetical protein [uncultured Clostridium sp.]|uniref:hypothetical protein n=1 Tax=uncultured Clostridium sp. TaxID=59620 RepID=UPI00263481F3|nr:hypothetical protein [uncultured Clostridium sp.]
MAQTTLWYMTDDSKFNDLDKSLRKKVFFKDSNSYPDFKIGSLLDSSKQLKLGDLKVKFDIYEYSFAGPNASTSRLTGTLVLFQFNDKLGFIVDKAGYTNTLAFLRELSGAANKKKTIVCENYDDVIKDGRLFLWMISKIYHNESSINYGSENTPKTITLNSLDGLKGNTRTGLNNVSTQGSDVINMLTTLAFLLESDRLTEVGLNISFEKHESLQLEIRTHNQLISLDVKAEDYKGSLYSNNLCIKNGKVNLAILRGMILLTVHLSLIPMLSSLYKSETAGVNIKAELIKDIREDMTNRMEKLNEEDKINNMDDSTENKKSNDKKNED